MSVADAYRDLDKVIKAEVDLWDTLGGWDARYSVVGVHDLSEHSHGLSSNWTVRFLMPGRELPENIDVQGQETEIMKEDDYDRLFEIGWNDFYLEMVNRIHKGVTGDMVRRAGEAHLSRANKVRNVFEQKGVHHLLDERGLFTPIGRLAELRSFPSFLRDLKYRYDTVKRAVLEVITPTFRERFDQIMRGASERGVKRLFVPLGRYVYPVIPRRVFEELVWSWLKRNVETIIAEGITPAFHFDADWSESFSYLKELPKGKCFVHWGGETDIFKAKEALRGHMCIMGGVSPAMISVTPPEEVEAHCRRLIDEVGKDNGFILCEGCYLPATAKFENVKVMVDVAKSHVPR